MNKIKDYNKIDDKTRNSQNEQLENEISQNDTMKDDEKTFS